MVPKSLCGWTIISKPHSSISCWGVGRDICFLSYLWFLIFKAAASHFFYIRRLHVTLEAVLRLLSKYCSCQNHWAGSSVSTDGACKRAQSTLSCSIIKGSTCLCFLGFKTLCSHLFMLYSRACRSGNWSHLELWSHMAAFPQGRMWN